MKVANVPDNPVATVVTIVGGIYALAWAVEGGRESAREGRAVRRGHEP